MTTNKLAIIGGSGLYDVEEFKDRELLDLNTPWGKPSDQILKTKYNNKDVYFLPRHGRGHFISPSNINFRANIDALKQLGVTDIVSVSAVGSLRDPTAETETISDTPNCLSASMFTLKLILDGEIKCPLPCLGKK